VLIGFSYYLLLDNGLKEFDEQFAAATVIVCVGTLLFFFSLSGFLVRAIQSSKKIYLRGLNMFTLRQLSAKINTAFISISLVTMALFLAITSACGGFALVTTFNESLTKSTIYDATFQTYYGGTSLNMNGGEPLDPEDVELWKQTAEADGYRIENALRREVADWDSIVRDSAQTTFYYSGLTLQDIYERTDHELSDSVSARSLNVTYLTAARLSDFNATRALAGLEPVSLEAGQYLMWADFEEGRDILQSFLEQEGTLEVFGTTLNPAQDTVDDLLAQTASFAMNPGTIVVPDELIPEDEEYYYAVLNVMYNGERAEVDEDFIQAVNESFASEQDYKTALGWPMSNLITAQEMFSQTTGLSLVIAYLAIYIGFVLLIACAAILALQQLSEAADNVSRYNLLGKIGTEEKMMNRALLTQIGIYFIFPLVVALCHAYVAMSVVVNIVSIYGNIQIAIPLAITVGVFVLLYAGYYLITYFASRTMIHQRLRA